MDNSKNLIANRKIALATSNRLVASRGSIDPEIVDKCLKANVDVVDLQWLNRHAKLIYLIGPAAYCDLADEAWKGKSPRGLMGYLVNKALPKDRD